jgi:hypothetical protein
MAQARTKALEVYHSQECPRCRKDLVGNSAVDHPFADRDMYADLTLRNEITSLLPSYDALAPTGTRDCLVNPFLVSASRVLNKVSNGGAVSAARPQVRTGKSNVQFLVYLSVQSTWDLSHCRS